MPTRTVFRTVDVPTPDGTADAYVAHPEGDGPFPAVLLYMDAIGLRPVIRTMAERLASHGYYVLAPNVFYRHGRAPVFELPDLKVPENREQLIGRIRPVMQAHTPERIVRDARAYLDFLDAQPEVRTGPAGVTGYCMGGFLALRTAAEGGQRVAAAAGFHPGFLVTDGPDSPHLLAPRITAELYYGYADDDPTMTAENIDTFEKALSAAGVRFTAEVYAGAPHGYTMSDTASYEPAAEERHWQRLLDLLGRTLAAGR
ncbi:dienelactone hydrolase family protein [Streptomyces gamaensis]|uniref:Dienelactone hydrolase family protein n=1 Tax=Streptomyces gamaensis TaxID=1763542 RepID=A0ABW0YYF2_9ACTN